MRASHLYLSFGTEIIYDDAEFILTNTDKAGIVGVNGAGKTTLFKLLLGEPLSSYYYILISDFLSSPNTTKNR